MSISVDLFLKPFKTRKKLIVTPSYFGVMSKIVLFVHAMIKGDMIISTKSCLRDDGHQ